MNQLRCNYEFNILPKDFINVKIICKKNKYFYPREKDSDMIVGSLLYIRDEYNYISFGNMTLYEE